MSELELSQLTHGDIVNVRLLGGIVEPRRVLRIQQSIKRVVICHESEWELAAYQGVSPRGLSFHVDDVQGKIEPVQLDRAKEVGR